MTTITIKTTTTTITTVTILIIERIVKYKMHILLCLQRIQAKLILIDLYFTFF